RPGYAELHCHSAYSFLDGASLPEELALRAAELGYPALALTDHDGVWGAMEHAQACSALGVRPIVGAELAVRPPPSPGRAEREPGAGAGVPGRGRGEPAGTGSGAAGAAPLHVTLLVESRAGWRNLCRLITEAHAGTRWPGEGGPRASPTAPSLPLAALAERALGLVCLSRCAWASPAWRPATPTSTIPGGPSSRTPSWPSATASRWTRASRFAAATRPRAWRRRRRWRAASPTTRRPSPRAPRSRSASASTSPATSATATRAPRTRRRTGPWRRSAAAASSIA